MRVRADSMHGLPALMHPEKTGKISLSVVVLGRDGELFAADRTDHRLPVFMRADLRPLAEDLVIIGAVRAYRRLRLRLRREELVKSIQQEQRKRQNEDGLRQIAYGTPPFPDGGDQIGEYRG